LFSYQLVGSSDKVGNTNVENVQIDMSFTLLIELQAQARILIVES